MSSVNGDSFLYILVEDGYENENFVFFKIGIVSHALTDDGVKLWKKYKESPYPTSITRRILKLNNGNPRQILPLAYFCFATDENGPGSKKSRSVETYWKRELRSRTAKTSSPEWFRTPIEKLSSLIQEIADSTKETCSQQWFRQC